MPAHAGIEYRTWESTNGGGRRGAFSPVELAELAGHVPLASAYLLGSAECRLYRLLELAMTCATHRPTSSIIVTALENSASQRLPVVAPMTSWYCVTLMRLMPVWSLNQVSSLICSNTAQPNNRTVTFSDYHFHYSSVIPPTLQEAAALMINNSLLACLTFKGMLDVYCSS